MARLRQHYHSDFGPLLQNVHWRSNNSPRSHDLTPVGVKETLPEIRLCRTDGVNGRSDSDYALISESAETVP